MRISDWSSDVCSSDLRHHTRGISVASGTAAVGSGAARFLRPRMRASTRQGRQGLAAPRDLSRWVPRRTRLQTDRRRLRPRVYIAHTNIRGIRARSVPIRTQHRRRYQTDRSEENTYELHQLMSISYDVFCLQKKK